MGGGGGGGGGGASVRAGKSRARGVLVLFGSARASPRLAPPQLVWSTSSHVAFGTGVDGWASALGRAAGVLHVQGRQHPADQSGSQCTRGGVQHPCLRAVPFVHSHRSAPGRPAHRSHNAALALCDGLLHHSAELARPGAKGAPIWCTCSATRSPRTCAQAGCCCTVRLAVAFDGNGKWLADVLAACVCVWWWWWGWGGCSHGPGPSSHKGSAGRRSSGKTPGRRYEQRSVRRVCLPPMGHHVRRRASHITRCHKAPRAWHGTRRDALPPPHAWVSVFERPVCSSTRGGLAPPVSAQNGDGGAVWQAS